MNVNMGEDEDQPNSPGPDTQKEDKNDSINLLPNEAAASEAAEAPSMPEEEGAEIITDGVNASDAATVTETKKTDRNEQQPEKPTEDKKEDEPKKGKAKKRKINMAWAAPPEDDPFAEPANYEDLTIGLPSDPDLPAAKRRKERKKDPERLSVERFEEIGPEPYGFEVEFCLPETVVAKQTMDFKNPQLISAMGVCSWQSANGRNFTAVTNTHSERRGGKGQIEVLESCDDTRMKIILLLPSEKVDCIEPTAVSALKNDGFVFLDKTGFTIINLREVGGVPRIVQKKSFRMLQPKKGPPMFSSRGKTGPCFGLFLSRKQEIGTFVNDEQRGPTLFWWNPHTGTHRIVPVNIPRYSQVRFAKHYGNIVALSDMNRNDFSIWLITIEGELVKKVNLNREDVRQPAGITFDKNGKILLADSKGQRVLYFDADGDYKGDITLDPPIRNSQKRITDISLDQRGMLTILSLDKTLSLYKVNLPSNDEDDTLVETEDFDPYAETVDFEPDMKDASRVEASQNDFDKDMAAFGDGDGESGAFKWTKKDTSKESNGWGSASKDESGQDAGWKSKEKNNSGWGSSKEKPADDGWSNSTSSANSWLAEKTSPRAARTRTPSPRKPLGATRTRSPSPAVTKPLAQSCDWGNKKASPSTSVGKGWGSQEESQKSGWADSSKEKPANDGWSTSAAPETSITKPSATGWGVQNIETNENTSGWGNKEASPSPSLKKAASAGSGWGSQEPKSGGSSENKPANDGWSTSAASETPAAAGWGVQKDDANEKLSGWGNASDGRSRSSSTSSKKDDGWNTTKSNGWGNANNPSPSTRKDDGWGSKSQQNDDWGKSAGSSSWGNENNRSRSTSSSSNISSGWGKEPRRNQSNSRGWGSSDDRGGPKKSWENNARSRPNSFSSKNDDNEWGRPPSLPRERRDNNRGSRSSRSPSPGGRKPWGGPQRKSDWGNRSADTWGNKEKGGKNGWSSSQDNAERAGPAKTSTAGWGNPTDSGDKGSGGWGSTTEPKNSGWGNPGPVTEGWGNTSAKQSSSPKTDTWGSSKSSSAGGWGNTPAKDDSSQKTDGWGATKSNSADGWGSTPTAESNRSRSNSTSNKADGWGASSGTSSNIGGWGNSADSGRSDASKNNSGWGNPTDSTSDKGSAGWGSSTEPKNAGWGNSSTDISSRSSSSSKNAEGWGAPSGPSNSTSGWGTSNEQSSDNSWGGSKKETSTGWGNSSRSSSPVPSTGWGISLPQEAVSSSGAPVWADSKAKPPPGYKPPVYIPPNAAQRRRWESKEEPVVVPSAKFLEIIQPIVPPRDPRLKKRISLDAYKQRPAPVIPAPDIPAHVIPAPEVAVTPRDPQSEVKKKDVKLPDAPILPNPELNESFEEPPSPPSPAFEPAETFLPVKIPENEILTAEQEEEFQKSILQDLEN